MTRLGISKVTLGLLILLFGVGAVVAMPWSGYLMSRHGSRKVVLGFAVIAAFGLLFVAACAKRAMSPRWQCFFSAGSSAAWTSP